MESVSQQINVPTQAAISRMIGEATLDEVSEDMIGYIYKEDGVEIDFYAWKDDNWQVKFDFYAGTQQFHPTPKQLAKMQNRIHEALESFKAEREQYARNDQDIRQHQRDMMASYSF